MHGSFGALRPLRPPKPGRVAGEADGITPHPPSADGPARRAVRGDAVRMFTHWGPDRHKVHGGCRGARGPASRPGAAMAGRLPRYRPGAVDFATTRMALLQRFADAGPDAGGKATTSERVRSHRPARPAPTTRRSPGSGRHAPGTSRTALRSTTYRDTSEPRRRPAPSGAVPHPRTPFRSGRDGRAEPSTARPPRHSHRVPRQTRGDEVSRRNSTCPEQTPRWTY